MVEQKIDQIGSIAIAATFTAEPLQPGLEYLFREAGLQLNLRFAPYHQVLQELISGFSTLSVNPKGVNVLLIRLEDFVREISDIADARAVIANTASEIAGALSEFVRRCKVPTILAVFPASPSAQGGLLATIDAANQRLTAHAAGLPGLSLLLPGDVNLVSAGECYDAESNDIGHMPFTEAYYADLALALTRKVHALLVPDRKVLVLDCDNTLWKGVVGEDGVEGLAISPAFASLQAFAVKVQAQGVLICLASKNSERDVLEVFETRAGMVLKLEHIVAHRINWESKPQNIAALAKSLSLGLESFVFIDDNPVECELMRAELPQVLTLLLPQEDQIESFLSHLWVFDKVAVTEEDKRRTDLYKEDNARKQLEQNASNIVDFVSSLKVVVDIGPPDESEWPRLAQLTQRTNQFNFTTVRRTEAELRAMGCLGSEQRGFVLRVRVSDRFGDYGLVGLVIYRTTSNSIVADTFLLSCRVLGRGVEHTVLRHLGSVAEEAGLPEVRVPLIRSARNEPAWAFAESVAAQFSSKDGDEEIYCIPTRAALAIQHRPGHDPEAVLKARDSEAKKSSAGASSVDVSGRYAALSQKLLTGQDVLTAIAAANARERTLPGEPVAASTEAERRMLLLWQEVLGIPDLGVEDDYVAAGGTSLLAARLFALMVQRFGVKLPLTTILDHSTVRKLARVVEFDRPQTGSLIELRPGGLQNFFFVHDGDGETLLYGNVARRLPKRFAVFGIEPRQLRDIPLAHARIEDMAAYYLDAMRQKQPHGPYFMGGMCAGGVIAYEMARQLETAGEDVGLLVLLDSALPTTPKRRGRIASQRMGRLSQLVAERGSNVNPLKLATAILRKIFNASVWEIVQRVRRWSVRVRFRLLRLLLDRELPWPNVVPGLTVRQIYDAAESGYVPRPAPLSALMLVRARCGQGGDAPFREVYADEVLGWGRMSNHLLIEDVDGGHYSMLQEPFAEKVAARLIAILDPEPAAAEQPPSLKVDA
jgi:FkbH-like protein